MTGFATIIQQYLAAHGNTFMKIMKLGKTKQTNRSKIKGETFSLASSCRTSFSGSYISDIIPQVLEGKFLDIENIATNLISNEGYSYCLYIC